MREISEGEHQRRLQKLAARQVLDLKSGEPVWYYPIWGDTRRRHMMVTDGEPRALGDEMVINLNPAPQEPGDDPPHRRVVAAALWAVIRRVDPKVRR